MTNPGGFGQICVSPTWILNGALGVATVLLVFSFTFVTLASSSLLPTETRTRRETASVFSPPSEGRDDARIGPDRALVTARCAGPSVSARAGASRPTRNTTFISGAY